MTDKIQKKDLFNKDYSMKFDLSGKTIWLRVSQHDPWNYELAGKMHIGKDEYDLYTIKEVIHIEELEAISKLLLEILKDIKK